MSRLRYLAKRSVVTLGLLFGIASALFFFFKAIPGDYATLIARSGASAEQLAALRARWGLDQPLHIQYYQFLVNMLTGNVGQSRRLGVPVWELVKPRLMNSFILVAPAIIIAYAVGSLYGALMGNESGTLLEKYGSIPPTAVGTMPNFFIGIVLIFFFSSMVPLFPSYGMVSSETYQEIGNNLPHYRLYLTTDFLWHYMLPFSTIVLQFLYLPSLIMRSSIIDTREQEFAYFYRLTGLSKYRRTGHLIKHASFPVITLFPVSLARAISGLVLVEVVFNWPGIGKLLVTSVLSRDIPVVQFVFLLVAVWIVLGNFAIDILYGLIDPRVAGGSDSTE
ncbi:ABC transporter permease [Halobium palmae]|uniref:ABC transporter permease n=1 Tax=Halobium palmae TaxID=1776492 RepID=A0ABD5RXQ6_9EURY